MATKAQMLKAIESLPDDATVREAIEHLASIASDEESVGESNAQPANGVATEAGRQRYQPMTRDELAASIQRMPDDATVDDAIERLRFIRLIEQRILDAEAHPETMIPQEEAKRRFAQMASVTWNDSALDEVESHRARNLRKIRLALQQTS